jgi:hypothetical protein
MGMADFERRVPGGEHGEVVLVEIVDRLGVVRGELALGDLVDPCAHELTQNCRRASRPTDSTMTRMASCGSMKHSGMAAR